jgi:peptidoglycan/xylan/chitin deacetylase (PgdA/CDA1 family)
MFHRTPFFLPLLYSKLVWRLPGDQQPLYLTFDDGPVPGPTEFTLDVLKHYDVKSTFFCIGDNINRYPDLFLRVVKEGHAIGNHTFNHLNGWKTSTSGYVQNIEQFNDQLVKTMPSLRTNLFRPPYGRITRRQIRMLSQYQIIMWDVLTNDYSNTVSPESCFRNSVKATRNGSIIVFHDSVKAEKNMMFTLPRFIEAFLERGFAFKKLE